MAVSSLCVCLGAGFSEGQAGRGGEGGIRSLC